MRLPLELEEGEFAVFRLTDGSKAEGFGFSDIEHTHFRAPDGNVYEITHKPKHR